MVLSIDVKDYLRGLSEGGCVRVLMCVYVCVCVCVCVCLVTVTQPETVNLAINGQQDITVRVLPPAGKVGGERENWERDVRLFLMFKYHLPGLR